MCGLWGEAVTLGLTEAGVGRPRPPEGACCSSGTGRLGRAWPIRKEEDAAIIKN